MLPVSVAASAVLLGAWLVVGAVMHRRRAYVPKRYLPLYVGALSMAVGGMLSAFHVGLGPVVNAFDIVSTSMVVIYLIWLWRYVHKED